MEEKEKALIDFAGYCFIHKPELASDINLLITSYIHSNGSIEERITKYCKKNVKYFKSYNNHLFDGDFVDVIYEDIFGYSGTISFLKDNIGE